MLIKNIVVITRLVPTRCLLGFQCFCSRSIEDSGTRTSWVTAGVVHKYATTFRNATPLEFKHSLYTHLLLYTLNLFRILMLLRGTHSHASSPGRVLTPSCVIAYSMTLSMIYYTINKPLVTLPSSNKMIPTHYAPQDCWNFDTCIMSNCSKEPKKSIRYLQAF